MESLTGMLIFVIVTFSSFGCWWHLSHLKQIAFVQANKRCQESGVQILDSTISLKRLWFKRNQKQRLKVWASYDFEFASTGKERYHGQVILLGKQTISVEMEAHVINQPEP